MTSKKRSGTNAYWIDLLNNANTSFRTWLDGFDFSAEPETKNHLASEKMVLNKSIFESLKKFARINKLSLNTLLQGAWGLLLNRYSSQDTLIYGSGYCSTTLAKDLTLPIHLLLPTLSPLDAQDSLLIYLKKLEKQIVKNKAESATFKLDSLVDKNLFGHLFLFEKSTKLPKKLLTILNKSDISLALVVPENNSNKISLLYSPTKFTKKTAGIALAHFQLILEKFLTDSDQLATCFSMLTGGERKTLLADWNKNSLDEKKVKESPCIHALFSQQAKQHPEKIAVVDEHLALTYQQLDNYSTCLAHDLLNKGIQSGDNIAILMERSPHIFIVMLAIFKIGAVYVPINPKYPDERIHFILEDCQAKIILVDSNNASKVSDELSKKILTFKMPTQNSDRPLSMMIDPAKIAYIIYTSGTTGQPKGVMIKHISLINHAYWYQKYFNINKNDRSAQFASQGFDSFFCETIPFLAYGASIHIVDDHTKLTPSLFLPWLATEKITICDLPTAYALILFTLPWPKKLSLHTVKIGGESVTRYPTQIFPFDIWNGYGPTETTIEATFIQFYKANTSPDQQPCKHIPPPIGKPVGNTEVYVVDKFLQPVPMGVAGELLIGGLGLSHGYLNRSQLTREKFIRNLFSNDQNEKLYRTGDLVRWLNDGNLEFIGRVDHQVKISGYRIELSEIENTLNQYPDVNEVIVLARDVDSQKKNLIAYLVPNLNKIRIPLQERCLLAINEMKFIELITEDFSKEGLAIAGLTESLSIKQAVRINVKLPGSDSWHWLTGKIVWQQEQRAGIEVDKSPENIGILNKSIEFYLSTHNLMQTVYGASAKRSLRKALKKKLPDYMIPSVFNILPEFPMTLNGKIDINALPAPQEFERLLERNYVAARTPTEKKLTEIWIELLHQKQISMTDNFFDLGGNSLLISQLSILILTKFNISVPAKILFDSPFISILAEYIDSKGKDFSFKSSIQDEINHDAILSENILPIQKLSPTLEKPQGILLTGAGGFLGIYLLRELLKLTDAKIYCLIRKGEFESPAKRLTTTLARFGLDKEISLNDRRIIIIDSDIGLDRFGISPQQYNSLAEKVDMIYHCGAQVNTMSTYPNLRNSNVIGTLEIIKFATHKVDKPIHYVSTLSSAYLLNKQGEYSEEFPDANSSSLTGGYAISKWVSERLLTQMKHRNLPVTIFRSGYILGQSDTGIMNLNDSLLLLIKGCIQLGFAPDWKELIAILPVDFVSKALISITLSTPTKSEVYHLDHPTGMMWTDLIAWLNDYGYNIKLCSHKKWQQKLTLITPENALYHFLPCYLSLETEPNTPRTSVTHTSNALKKLGMSYPEMDNALLRRYMDYLCKIKFLPVLEKQPIPVNENLT